MINTLSLLLLLDYSGSMDQTIDQKPKIKILKEQIGGILGALDEEPTNQAILFGSNPSKKCEDLLVIESSSRDLARKLDAIKPGAYGKTPLSKGIRKIGSSIVSTTATTAIVLTDGGDSCNQDPCAALKAVNADLNRVKKNIKLFLIAFDINVAKSELKCLKNLKLSNIDLVQLNALGTKQFNEALKSIQISLLGLGANSKYLPARGEVVFEGSQSRDRDNDEILEKSSQSKNDLQKKKISFVEILGAPIDAEFLLENAKTNRTWKGNFILQTTPGAYSVKFLDSDGLKITIDLAPEEHRQIHWATLMKDAKTKLNSSDNLLEFQLIPTEETKLIHDIAESINIKTNFNSMSDQSAIEVPFGEYHVKIISPVWLKDRTSDKKVDLKRRSNQIISILDLYKDQVQVIENPEGSDFSVLDLSIKGSKNERYLISPGQLKIPIPINSVGTLLKKKL